MKDRLALFADQQRRFFTALLIIPPYLLTSTLFLKAALLLLLLTLLPLSGKKFRLGMTLIMFFSILIFQLLSPLGEILWQIGPLIITRGALERGALKGMTFIGLIQVSLISIRPGLHLPGEWGALLTRTFYYFARFMDRRDKLERKNLLAGIDAVLTHVYDSEIEGSHEKGDREERRGWAYLFILSSLFWGIYLLGFLIE